MSAPFASFEPGQVFEWTHRVTAADLEKFLELSGDDNPLHLDAAFARGLGYKDRVAYGALSVAYLSALIGTKVPGPGAVWLSQNIRFEAPVYPGDTLRVRARVKQKNEALRALSLEIEITKEDGSKTAAGEAVVAEPAKPAESAAAAKGEALVTLPASAGAGPRGEGVALVTGGSRGIGAAICEALAARGWRVLVNYRASEAAAKALASRLGGKALAGDACTAAGAKALFEAAHAAYGRVDVVVHNAHPGVDKKAVGQMGWTDYARHLEAAVGAGAELARLAHPGMKSREFGRLIFVASSATIGLPPAQWSGYVAAKAALLGLTRALAAELAADGVTCNAVSPALVPTDLWSGLTENQLRAMALRNPTRRLTTVGDVGAAVAFLASPEAGHVNGTNVPVTGGEAVA